jgi:hypothetical protein
VAALYLFLLSTVKNLLNTGMVLQNRLFLPRIQAECTNVHKKAGYLQADNPAVVRERIKIACNER